MKKTMQVVTISLFCAFLFVMGLMYFLLPKKTFSDLEKRYLAEPPAFTAESVLSGNWGDEAETYLADHMPGRDFFVGLNAYFEAFTGRQKTKDVWTEKGRLLEAPLKADDAVIEKNMRSIRAFAQKAGGNVDLMIIPSVGWYLGIPQYQDHMLLEKIQTEAEESLRMVDLTETLTAEDFYRTDHHWTSGGAFKAYKAYLESLGMSPREDFTKEVFDGFHGSVYSRSGLWLTEPESLELWTGSDALSVEIGEERHEGIFWRENLQKLDKYTVFLGGNHPLVRIKNPEAQGKLLVIRDSFSNCLGGFLAESFGEVVLVDLRYYKQPVSQLVTQEDFDHILICYGLKNFMTDQNLPFLQR